MAPAHPSHVCINESRFAALEAKMASVTAATSRLSTMETKLDTMTERLGHGNVEFAVLQTQMRRIEWAVYGAIASLAGAGLVWLVGRVH